MQNRYRIFDTKDTELYIGVLNHYFTTSDAKKVYRDSLQNKEKDDSIMIEIAKKDANEVDGVITFGVEEGEQFALALLNLCNSIKR
ncbi:hypothetical protein [Gracilibacillus saliphilus]|uniref:hypothetical protein n=1 Tax=Gracilibacillus saliphilus TaxID=543890 RepID=UPI0013D590A7|nr:hypothetical protein [Gracilibacillus saliphilus]